ncbi:MAG: hypothetical protein FD123_266 [Bacteroidetes bacterium]|nr:MAG: hypothetical protein FD123_266 [Bacteroidota bacterium]
MITDLFENITLFENKVTVFGYKKQPDGKYKVNMTVESQKFRADGVGNEKEIPVNDWIDIGIFANVKEKGKYERKPLYFQKQKITKNKTELEFFFDQKPAEGGIDPYNKLIDRHPDDNVTGPKVSMAPVVKKK